MSVQTLELKPAVSAAAVVRVVKAPLKVPAWSVVLFVIMAAIYGYVSGRQNPVHHYVPYIGYPLVLDTTTGKACYSTTPRPSESGAAVNALDSADLNRPRSEAETSLGPAIPMCEK